MNKCGQLLVIDNILYPERFTLTCFPDLRVVIYTFQQAVPRYITFWTAWFRNETSQPDMHFAQCNIGKIYTFYQSQF